MHLKADLLKPTLLQSSSGLDGQPSSGRRNEKEEQKKEVTKCVHHDDEASQPELA